MELDIREAKARVAERVTAVRDGDRVAITRRGRPHAKLACRDRCGGIDLEKLEAARRRPGSVGDGEDWPAEYNDPTFSREVLGLDDKR